MVPPDPNDELCRAFLAAQGGATASSLEPACGLTEALAAAIELGANAWPELVPDRVGFAGFLGHRVPADRDAAAMIGELAVADLYLAFASLTGEPRALALLEERYFRELPALLVRQGIPDDVATEAAQITRVRLLTGARPRLLAYGGTGQLRGWLRITALRSAIRIQRGAQPRELGDEALAAATVDLDLQYQQHLYRHEFRAAFAEALAWLTVRERNLLKHSVLYGATSDDLAALYRVHRATAARWLGDARERLGVETRRRMIERLGVGKPEYESILRLIQSQLDVSVARLLADESLP